MTRHRQTLATPLPLDASRPRNTRQNASDQHPHIHPHVTSPPAPPPRNATRASLVSLNSLDSLDSLDTLASIDLQPLPATFTKFEGGAQRPLGPTHIRGACSPTGPSKEVELACAGARAPSGPEASGRERPAWGSWRRWKAWSYTHTHCTLHANAYGHVCNAGACIHNHRLPNVEGDPLLITTRLVSIWGFGTKPDLKHQLIIDVWSGNGPRH